MDKVFCKKLLVTISLLTTMIFMNFTHADTQKLIIESGDNAKSRQRAQMEKDQWRDNSNLRKKMNQSVILPFLMN